MDSEKTTEAVEATEVKDSVPTTWVCANCGNEVPGKQDYCNKCGSYKPEVKKPEEMPKKFCNHCGNQLHIEAVICPSCGCAVAPMSQPAQSAVTPKKKKPVLLITLLSIVAVILAAVGVLAALILPRPNVKMKDLVEVSYIESYFAFGVPTDTQTDDDTGEEILRYDDCLKFYGTDVETLLVYPDTGEYTMQIRGEENMKAVQKAIHASCKSEGYNVLGDREYSYNDIDITIWEYDDFSIISFD